MNLNANAYKFNVAMAPRVQSLCEPFINRKLPEGDCGYIRTYRDGSVLRMGKHLRWIDIFFNQELYNHPSHRYFNPDLIDSNANYTSNFGEPQGRVSEAFCKEAKLWNQFVIHRFKKDYIESLSFSTASENTEVHEFYFNNISVLERFMDDFEMQMTPFIEASDMNDRFHLDNVEGIVQLFEQIEQRKKEQRVKLLPGVDLSPREYECLTKLSLGKSAKEIGRILGISSKTVEGHIDNIRIKTSLNTKSQILEAFFASPLVDLRFRV